MIRRRVSRDFATRTPYVTQTTRTRNLLTETVTAVSTREQQLRLKDLFCFKTWSAHRVSPLYFSYKSKKLQDYSNELQSYLESDDRDLPATVGKRHSFSVVFSVVKGVACTEADSEAIKITVTSRAKQDNAKDSFTGILLSVERENKYEIDINNNRKHLPLFLTQGSVSLTKEIICFLQDTFNCSILPLILSSLDLMWMLAMWAVNQCNDGNRPLMLEYAIPRKELHTIQYTIDSNTIVAVWSRIRDPQSNRMRSIEVQDFINSLEKHFHALFKIELSHFCLRSVGTPVAAVRCNGSIKILNPNALQNVLRHLTSLAQDIEIH